MNATLTPASPALSFPASLRTATPAEGHRLAQRLTAIVLADGPGPARTIADMLRQPAAPPAALVTAIYFHAIAVANGGWSGG